MSQPIPTTAAPANRIDDATAFPTVATSAIKPIAHLLRTNVTSPQLDLDGMDFFAMSQKAQLQADDVTATRDAALGETGESESSFGPSVLARGILQGSGSKDPSESAKLRKPRLLVLRGERVDVQYTIYPGKNYMGRTDSKPVDIDLENQEPADRIWSSRQHAMINFENGQITLEDLGSLNGTFVNRTRIEANKPKLLQENDVVQIGTVQLKLILA